MEIPKQTDYDLPLVTIETGLSLLGDMAEKGLDDFTEQAHNRLETNNPDLYEMLASIMERAGLLESDEQLEAAHTAMILTHELLAKQAEAASMVRIMAQPEE